MERERPSEEAFEEADAALSAGEYERVEELLGAWTEDDVRDPDACAFVGLAHFYAQDFEGARPLLEWALEHEAGGAEARLGLGACQYLEGELEEAEANLRGVVEEEPEWAPGHHWLGRLLEWRGRTEPALRDQAAPEFERAAALDPEGYPVPLRLTEAEFDAVVEEAIRELPDPIREGLERLTVVADDFPHDSLLPEGVGPELMGLFTGHSALERTTQDTGQLPGVIHLFQRNLELWCVDREELVEEIRVTLLHEVGHALGMEEEELEELDL